MTRSSSWVAISYFTDEFAAGVTIDLGGDVDTITFGGRWFFGGRRIK